MRDTLFISGIMDAGAKLFLQKSFIPLIGKTATVLLHHICNRLEQDQAVYRGGRFWYQQNIQQTCWQACLSQAGLYRAKQTLLDEDLIAIRQEKTGDRTLWWAVNAQKLTRFFYFAEALHHARKPDSSTFEIWEAWARNNQAVIAEFRHLYPRINQYLYFLMERRPKTSEVPVEEQKSQKLNVRMVERENGAENPFEWKEKAQKPEMRTSRWVEYWNSLPHTPKCKRGTKNYAQATRFFNAHRHYKAGQCGGFVLTPDVREKIGLDEINTVPHGTDGVRPIWEMEAHIKQAAKAYDPEYAPMEKQYLGDSLPQFLYRDGQYGKRGTLSLFLEKIAFAPRKIENESYDDILSNIEEPQEYVIKSIQRVFYYTNGRSSNQRLTLAELKTAVSIARNILKEYAKIPRFEIGIFHELFGDYMAFIRMWEDRVIDWVWDGMSLGALNTNKRLWQRFIDTLQNEMDRDLFTGERI